MRFAFLFFVMQVLVGCVSNVENLTDDGSHELKEGAGYLLLAVDTNISLYSIIISGEKMLRLTSDDLGHGENFILAKVPAGNYRINRVNQSKDWYIKPKRGKFDFSVEENSISYVGHLKSQGFFFSGAYMDVENRSVEALTYLEEYFPELLGENRLVYNGPGQDEFLERMQNLGMEEK